MKEMSKPKIIDKKSEHSIKAERDLLSHINHKFLINMHFAFQDNDNLYLVIDLLTGGDLRYHICKHKKFTEEQTKFFIACIILGLEYCHYNSIIHRDIKPENLVLNERGYVHITDFGIAKIQQPNNCKETSGTPGYMSPEVICAQNHTTAVDYFAVGVIGYEFMKGVRPYLGKNRKEIKEKILSKQVSIKASETEGWSIESADCINKMLERKAKNRLGFKGADEVKTHIWFKNFPWKELYLQNMNSPFKPNHGDNFDYNYCNAVEKQGINTKERYVMILSKPEYKIVFNDYYYFDRYSESYNHKQLFDNVHEKMYGCGDGISDNKSKIKKMIIEHNRYKSVDEQQCYGKYNHNKMFDVGKGNYINNNNMHNNNSSSSSSSNNHHGRTRSTIGGNSAFCEANNFIARRKMLQKNSSNHNLLLNKNKIIKQHNEGGTHTVFLRRAMSSSIIPSSNNNNNINSNQGESSSQIYLQGSTMNSNNNNNNNINNNNK